MHKQTGKKYLLKKTNIRTRLHQAPVFKVYKPDNEKVKQHVLYRGAMTLNALTATDRNMSFNQFKSKLKRDQYL